MDVWGQRRRGRFVKDCERDVDWEREEKTMCGKTMRGYLGMNVYESEGYRRIRGGRYKVEGVGTLCDRGGRGDHSNHEGEDVWRTHNECVGTTRYKEGGQTRGTTMPEYFRKVRTKGMDVRILNKES